MRHWRPLLLLLALGALNALALLHTAAHPLSLDEANCELCLSGTLGLPPLPFSAPALSLARPPAQAPPERITA